MQHRYQRPGWRAALLALLLLLALAATGPAQAAQVDEVVERGGVVVVVVPVPNVEVAPGDLLTYQVIVKNFNRNERSNIRVFLPYDSAQLSILSADFESEDDWVSELTSGHVLITFDHMDGSETRSARLNTYVNPALPTGTVINTWPSYSWANSPSERQAVRSNAAPVVVGPTTINSPFVWMAVEPSRGTPDSSYSFFSDRFVPNERVEMVLHTVGQPPLLQWQGRADAEGRLWLTLPPDVQLAPGTYELVTRGLLSNLQGLVSFVVEPA